MIVIGVDIGVQGAIAILNASGELIEVHEMPVLHDEPAGRRSVNGPLLASIIFASHADHAFVEHVAARPGEGAVGAFAFASSKASWPPPASPARLSRHRLGNARSACRLAETRTRRAPRQSGGGPHRQRFSNSKNRTA